MAEYQIFVDVTFSGTMYIEASNKKEAKQKARSKQLVPSDLKNYYHRYTRAIEAEEVQ